MARLTSISRLASGRFSETKSPFSGQASRQPEIESVRHDHRCHQHDHDDEARADDPGGEQQSHDQTVEPPGREREDQRQRGQVDHALPDHADAECPRRGGRLQEVRGVHQSDGDQQPPEAAAWPPPAPVQAGQDRPEDEIGLLDGEPARVGQEVRAQREPDRGCRSKERRCADRGLEARERETGAGGRLRGFGVGARLRHRALGSAVELDHGPSSRHRAPPGCSAPRVRTITSIPRRRSMRIGRRADPGRDIPPEHLRHLADTASARYAGVVVARSPSEGLPS